MNILKRSLKQYDEQKIDISEIEQEIFDIIDEDDPDIEELRECLSEVSSLSDLEKRNIIKSIILNEELPVEDLVRELSLLAKSIKNKLFKLEIAMAFSAVSLPSDKQLQEEASSYFQRLTANQVSELINAPGFSDFLMAQDNGALYEYLFTQKIDILAKGFSKETADDLLELFIIFIQKSGIKNNEGKMYVLIDNILANYSPKEIAFELSEFGHIYDSTCFEFLNSLPKTKELVFPEIKTNKKHDYNYIKISLDSLGLSEDVDFVKYIKALALPAHDLLLTIVPEDPCLDFFEPGHLPYPSNWIWATPMEKGARRLSYDYDDYIETFVHQRDNKRRMLIIYDSKDFTQGGVYYDEKGEEKDFDHYQYVVSNEKFKPLLVVFFQ